MGNELGFAEVLRLRLSMDEMKLKSQGQEILRVWCMDGGISCFWWSRRFSCAGRVD